MNEKKLDLILTGLKELKLEQTTIKDEISTIKSNQSTMKSDIANMKDEITTIKSDQATMKVEISTIKNDQSSMKKELKSIHETIDVLYEQVAKNAENITEIRIDTRAIIKTQKQQDRTMNMLSRSSLELEDEINRFIGGLDYTLK